MPSRCHRIRACRDGWTSEGQEAHHTEIADMERTKQAFESKLTGMAISMDAQSGE